MSIGENLKVLRKKAKKNQTEFAKDIGISRTYLSDLENNRKSLSLDTIEKIAKKLNVSTTYLIEGKYMLRDIHIMPDEQRRNFLDEFGKPIITDDFANKRFNQAMKRFSESVDNKYIKTDMAILIDALIDIKEKKVPDKYLESEIESISSELAKIPFKMAKLDN